MKINSHFFHMISKRQIILLIANYLIYFSSLPAYCQNDEYSLRGTPQNAPYSINYNHIDDANVNLSSGTLNSSFSIANLNGHNIHTDVNLKYTHGKGIKVMELPSPVGIGFELKFGGNISREVRGVADENIHNPSEQICHVFDYSTSICPDRPNDTLKSIDPDGQHYLYGWFDKFNFHMFGYTTNFNSYPDCSNDTTFKFPASYLDNLTIGELVSEFKSENHFGDPNLSNKVWQSAKFLYLNNVSNGIFDSEPDIFHFEFGKYYGSFILDLEGNVVFLDQQDIIIQQALVSNGFHTNWVFTTPDGEKYIFENSDTYRELLTVESETGFPDKPLGPPFCGQDQDESISTFYYISKWNLTRIECINGEVIEFNYITNGSHILDINSELQQDVVDIGQGTACQVNPYNSNYNYSFISRHLNLNSTETSTTEKFISSIILKYKNIEQGKIEFLYSASYNFHNNQKAIESVSQYDYKNQIISRIDFGYDFFSNGNLKLLYYCSYPNFGSASCIKTQFEYYEDENLPDIDSKEQDLWGYYNGANNSTLIPEITLKANEYSFLTSDQSFSGANRDPNLSFTRANVLKRIILPTGGYKEFEYELNSYYDTDLNQNIPFGGLRIKKIILFDGLNTGNNIISEYSYNLEGSTHSSGQTGIVKKWYDVQNYGNYQIDSSNYYTHGYPQVVASEFLYLLRTSNKRRIDSSDGLIYSRVSLHQEGNGNTVYEFTNHSDFPDESEKVVFQFLSQDPTNNYHLNINYFGEKDNDAGAPLTDNSNKRGLLKGTKIFNESGDIVKEILNEYEYVDESVTVFALKCKKSAEFFMWYPCETIYNTTSGYPANWEPAVNNSGFLNTEYYKLRNPWHYLANTIVRTYEVGTLNYIQVLNEFSYESPSRLKWVKSYGSDGTEYKSDYRLVSDFPIPSSGNLSEEVLALKSFKENNILGIPIEVINSYNDGSNYLVTSASLTSFKLFNGTPLPFQNYIFDTKHPVGDLIVADIQDISGIYSFVFDDRYRLTTTQEEYDNYGNLLTESIKNGLSYSYVYGMNNTVPIAKFINGKVGYDSIAANVNSEVYGIDCGYTGFEDLYTNGWSIEYGDIDSQTHYSGTNSLEVPYGWDEFNFQKHFYPDNLSQTFVLSAWVKTESGFGNDNGEIGIEALKVDDSEFNQCYENAFKKINFSDTHGEWQYIEVELNGQDLIGYTGNNCNGSVNPISDFHIVAYSENHDTQLKYWIDEIRFHPKNTLVTSIIYDPVFNKVYTTYDSNGRSTGFIDYDEFGRKEFVSDNEGNVLQFYEYHIYDSNITDDHNYTIIYTLNSEHTKNGFLDSLNNNLLDWKEYTKEIKYSDGLDRPLQTVFSKQSPIDGSTGKDLVTFYKYDNLGRNLKYYLPFVDESSDGNFKNDVETKQNDFYSSTEFIAHDNSPYSEIKYDESPLNKIIEMGSVGDDWKLESGHTKKISLKCNLSNEVLKWIAGDEGTGAEASTYYESNTLYKKISIDENGNTSMIFTDVLGRIIMKQLVIQASRDPNNNIVTKDFTNGNESGTEDFEETVIQSYFIYNNMGQLIYTIPYKAIEQMNGTYSFTESDEVFQQFVQSSRYDSKGRLQAIKKPGMPFEIYIYDKLNRPVLSQNGNQQQIDEWSFVKYDVFGRPIITGLLYSSEDQTSLQSIIDSWSENLWESRFNGTNNIRGYSNDAFPEINFSNGDKLLTIKYYDDYDFDLLGHTFQSNGSDIENLKIIGLQTGTLIKVLSDDDNEFLLNINFYDDKYRLKQSDNQNHLLGWDIHSYSYNFKNQVVRIIRKHFANNSTFPLIESTKYEYDYAGRLINEYVGIGSGELVPGKRICNYEYNLLGQVIRKNLDYKPADDNYLQQIDYRYNIRGWLSSINNSSLTNDGEINLDENDIFGEQIYYNNGNELTIDDEPHDAFVALNQYNGNISAITWKTRHTNIESSSKPEHIYVYRYDNLNQFTAAYYGESSIGAPGIFDNNYHSFDEKLIYDISGNIVNLERKSLLLEVDDLDYSYDGNQLIKVEDNINQSYNNSFEDGSNTGNDYEYDNNGNQTNDLNKGLTFQYNYLNLLTQISDGANEANYLYDAVGRKLSMIDENNNQHDYVDGIEYLNGAFQFISTSQGRIISSGPQVLCSNNFVFQYFIHDHLGNVRAIITRDENADEHNYLATLESSNVSTESQIFYNINSTQSLSPSALSSTTSSSYSSKLNSSDEPIGPSKVLYVQEGDKISIDVKYYYQTFTGTNNPRNISDILAQLANFFIINGNIAPSGLESNWASSTFTSNTGVSNFLNDFISSASGSDVLGYLAYITVDSDFNLIDNASGILSVTTANSVQDLAIFDIAIPKNGYIYIFVGNESPTDLYFDNLHIIHKKSNVIELNDYYPYGLLNSALSQSSLSMDPVNLQGYQSKQFEKSLSFNTCDFETRQYNPLLGRWNEVDHLMQFINPYISMNNNPISTVDPTGTIGFTANERPETEGVENALHHESNGGGMGGVGGYYDGLALSSSQANLLSGNSVASNNFDYLHSDDGNGVTFTFYQAYNDKGEVIGLTADKKKAELLVAPFRNSHNPSTGKREYQQVNKHFNYVTFAMLLTNNDLVLNNDDIANAFATYSVNGIASVRGQELTIGASGFTVVQQLGDVSFYGTADLLLDGQVIESQSFKNANSLIYESGKIPIGIARFNLPDKAGVVRVQLRFGYLFTSEGVTYLPYPNYITREIFLH